MVNIQNKNVPAETHDVLRKRAASAGQSLQAYVCALLVEEASHPTLEEVLDRAGNRTGGSIALSVAAEVVRRDRDSR